MSATFCIKWAVGGAAFCLAGLYFLLDYFLLQSGGTTEEDVSYYSPLMLFAGAGMVWISVRFYPRKPPDDKEIVGGIVEELLQ